MAKRKRYKRTPIIRPKKYCRFKKSGIKYIDYKIVNLELNFIYLNGKLIIINYE